METTRNQMTPEQVRELLEKAKTWHEVQARNRVWDIAPKLLELWVAASRFHTAAPSSHEVAVGLRYGKDAVRRFDEADAELRVALTALEQA